MDYQQGLINRTFGLGKGKDGKFQVGEWVNNILYSCDGTNTRLATRQERTKWKNFRETRTLESDSKLPRGLIHYVKEDEKPVGLFVICEVSAGTDLFNYIVGR